MELVHDRRCGEAGGVSPDHGLDAKSLDIAPRASFQNCSLYHHFPGGKDELAAEVIARSGADYQRLVEGVWDSQPDVVSGVREVFEGAADVLEATDYADVCPIATIALEVAGTNEELRLATADILDAWVDSATTRLAGAGSPPATPGPWRTR